LCAGFSTLDESYCLSPGGTVVLALSKTISFPFSTDWRFPLLQTFHFDQCDEWWAEQVPAKTSGAQFFPCVSSTITRSSLAEEFSFVKHLDHNDTKRIIKGMCGRSGEGTKRTIPPIRQRQRTPTKDLHGVEVG
jgi:hypothetical protein